MKVVIRTPFGDQVFDSDHVAILLDLDENEKQAISELDDSQNQLFSFPNGFPIERLQDWEHQ